MPDAAFFKFHCFVEDLAEGKHNLGSDDLKVYLSNAAPDAAADLVKTDLAEITAANGYTAGGISLTGVVSSQTTGTYKLVANPVEFVASGGSFGPARYAYLYNNTHASKPLIGGWDRGQSETILAGDKFQVNLHATNGILTLGP